MEKQELTTKLGLWLKTNRKANSLYQKDLADLLKLSVAAVSLIESGKNAISIFNYLILTKYFSGLAFYAHLDIDLQDL